MMLRAVLEYAGWALAGAAVVAAMVLREAVVIGAALAVIAVLAWRHRAWWSPKLKSALAAVSRWNDLQHARAVARRDSAPAYWASPAQSEDHEHYRATWAELVAKGERSDADDAALVQILRGLKRYGDDPLATPPTPRPLGLAGAIPAVGPLRLWPIYVLGALLLALGAQSLRVERLKDDVEDMRAVAQGWADRAAIAEDNTRIIERARNEAILRSAQDAIESADLMEERDELRRQLRARQTRRRHEAQARTDADIIDFGERLRELADPAAVPGMPGADAAGDTPG